MNMTRFFVLPLLGILRGFSRADIEPLVGTMCRAGLVHVEITLNTPGACDLIREMTKVANGNLVIGAGTVLSCAEMDQALEAGASFIVMPVLIPDVVRACVHNRIPVFPGALTPQEIFAAWDAGATMVKVFPANCFGPSYFKDIHGPFKEIPLLAVGGVNAETIPRYFECGASGVAFGASIFRQDWIQGGQFSRIEDDIKRLVDICRSRLVTQVPAPKS